MKDMLSTCCGASSNTVSLRIPYASTCSILSSAMMMVCSANAYQCTITIHTASPACYVCNARSTLVHAGPCDVDTVLAMVVVLLLSKHLLSTSITTHARSIYLH